MKKPSKAILVQASGASASGVVTERTNIISSSVNDLNTVISNGVKEIEDIFNGIGIENPAEMKRCSSCAKKGRMPFHPIGEFSPLKNGTRLSQCKTCRVEQSMAWEEKRREERRAYHRAYQANRKPPNKRNSSVKALAVSMTADETKGLYTKDSMFVAFTEEDIESTEQ